MICPSCGCDNDAEAVFCDECGVQLRLTEDNSKEDIEYVAPFVPEQIIWDTYKVLSILQNDLNCILYEVEKVEGGERCLVCELVERIDRAEDIFKLLRSLNSDYIWHCDQLKEDELGKARYLIGEMPGIPLRRYLVEKAVTYIEVAKIGCDILEGLGEVHKFGYVYNGISPDSVWISAEGRARLVRFDRVISKAVAVADGTVVDGFSAPEVYGLDGGKLTRRSDIFSVGALLLFMLLGRELSFNEDGNSVLPTTLRFKAKNLTKVIDKAVKREPSDRWLSASEMAQALSACITSSSTMSVNGVETAPATGYAQTTNSTFGRYVVAKKSHVGAVRKVNQDAFLEMTLSVCERDIPTIVNFVAIIDGMGGEAEGDKAASLAARAIASELVRLTLPLKNDGETTVLLPEDPKQRNSFIIERVVKKANEVIFAYASKAERRKGMGCTISCVLLDGDQATFGHVGDTRGYRMANDLDQVTTDHSFVGQLVQMGALTREEARHSPKRSIIYRALGTQPDVEVEVYQRVIAPREYIMLSSDGVWEYYSDEELFSYFTANLTPSQICENLISTCLERGANDNATVAIIRHM
ncbi:protein phosphatase 2C domain-containing protein [bacterium]|nr:protein phosphatase 2C domain-containing protein [bacterium]